MHITRNEINEMGKVERLNLINSLGGYKQPNLIGTKGDDEVENLAIFSSVIHLGSNPPLLGMITRPNVIPRDTYRNIKETGIYTINMVDESIIEKAHQTSAKYKKSVSEFTAVGLEPTYLNNFKAPFVKRSNVQMAMKFVEEYPIKANGTILIVGEIIDVHLNLSKLEEDGGLDLSKLEIVTSSGVNTYYSTKKVRKLDYAKPS